MKSDIICFVEEIRGHPRESKDNLQKAKIEVLRQFDEWREKENPHILSIKYGYFSDHPGYQIDRWWIEVFYSK